MKLASFILLLLGAGESPRVDYARDIKPILKERCFACHGALKQESSLRLDAASFLLKGGDGGAVIVAGKPAESELVRRISAEDLSERMPPEGKPLSSDQIKTIRAWIEQGSATPADDAPEQDPRRHWAFVGPVRPAIPAISRKDWARNPIDHFIAARQEQKGLAPLAEADKPVLLRRLSLALIGLPPSRDELNAFLADSAPDAYERMVDRLLASPLYGERWGRHWMDVWRYSDWYGRRSVPDVLNSYAQIWRWRDWIVRSLNEERGYDHMVRMMIAADELAADDDAELVATGFVVRNWYRWNYNTWMKEAVEHTSKAFLGLTLNCCHCHDHKYDPIRQEEYFAFRAFFEPLELRHDRAPGEPDPGVFPKYSYGVAYKPITSGAIRVFDEKLDAKTFFYTGGESRNIVPDKPPIAPAGPAIIGGDKLDIRAIDLPAKAWYPALKEFVQKEETDRRQADAATARANFDTIRTEQAARLPDLIAKVVEVKAALGPVRLADPKGEADDEKKLRAQLERAEHQLQLAIATIKHGRAQALSAAAELESFRARSAAEIARFITRSRDAEMLAEKAVEAERRSTQAKRDDSLLAAEKAVLEAKLLPDSDAQRAAAIQAAEKALQTASSQPVPETKSYSPLGPQYPKQSTGRRAALARLIASDKNPLTARVAVNHIWLRHFGRAVVDSTANLGRNGAAPTHPELLDWLAVELMESGWSTKHIHRLIVTSSTYRLRSNLGGETHPNQAIDPDNRLVWRFNPRRMEAEVIRDSILRVSGDLQVQLGGREIEHEHGLTNARRSLYFSHHGESKMQFLELFDAANPCDCYTRTTSVMPQQALALANSALANQQAESLANRIPTDSSGAESGDLARFITVSFEQVLSRRPSAGEVAAAVEFLEEQRALLQGSPATTAGAPASAEVLTRAKRNFLQALFSHGDFVTVR